VSLAARTSFEVSTADAIRLRVEHIPASAPAVGAMWCGHAMMANRKSLDRPRGGGLASVLARHGLEVYLADLRGHGESAITAPEVRDSWSYDDVVALDLPALTSFIRMRHPGLPVAGLGHSLAGHCALAWLGRCEALGADPPLDALVTFGANIWLREMEPSRIRWARKRATMEVFGAAARALGRIPARALGFGSDDVSLAFALDLHRFVSTSRWFSHDGFDYLRGLEHIRTPVLAVLGSGDELLCHPVAGRHFHDALPCCTTREFGPPQVGFAPGHMELTTDLRSAPIWHEAGRWVAATLLRTGLYNGATTARR